jgi:hypothetical protein
MSNEVTATPASADPVARLDNVAYNVIDGPGEKSQFVVEARGELLQQLRIGKIVADIDRSDDLLHIAACGVAGFSHPETKKTLSDQVASLQINLRNATGEMSTSLGRFGASAQTVCNRLGDAFEELYSLHESDAIDVLQKCEVVATKMSEEAEGLEKKFGGVSDEAAGVLTNTLSTRDLKALEKEKAEERTRRADERHQRMLDLSTRLAEQIPKVEARYEEAKSAQATADTRVFALGMTSAIMQGIGAGISAGLAIKTAPMRAATEVGAALAETRVKPSKKGKGKAGQSDAETSGSGASRAAAYEKAKQATLGAKADLKEAKEREATAKTAFEDAEEPYDDAKTLYETAVEKKAKDVEKKKKAFQAAEKTWKNAKNAWDKAKSTKADVETEVEAAVKAEAAAKGEAEAESKANDTNAALGGVGAGINKAGEGAGQAADNYATVAGNYAKEKAEYLKTLMELQKEQREALSEIAMLTKQMMNEGVTAELAQAAVDSLQKAVGALREIVVIIGDLKLFWAQMAMSCRKLAETDVREKIERCMKRSAAERIAEYSSQRFQVRLLQLTAKWVALNLVAAEYKVAVSLTHKKMGETFKQNPTIEEARKLAKDLSANLVKKIEVDVAKIDASQEDISAAINELKEAA